MELREIQEVKLQGLHDTLDMTERRKWALGLRFQGRMNCDSIPGVRKLSRRAAVGRMLQLLTSDSACSRLGTELRDTSSFRT